MSDDYRITGDDLRLATREDMQKHFDRPHCCFRTQAECDADPCDKRSVWRHNDDVEFAGYVRGVRFGVFITVGFILALGAAVRIGVAIWEMVR